MSDTVLRSCADTNDASDGSVVLGEAARILAAADDSGLTVRLLGGAAIALRCPTARSGPLERDYSDLDLVTDRRSAMRLENVLAGLGYEADAQFNALHGRSRLMFDHHKYPHLDVFVERFSMCHELNLGARLGVDELTIPLADLWLTKLQVAKLNRKDVLDVVALLADWELARDDSGVNQPYIVDLLSRDWGWWRTVTENTTVIADHLPALGLGEVDEMTARSRMQELARAVEIAPKTMRWKTRARVGERLPWREEPEESRD